MKNKIEKITRKYFEDWMIPIYSPAPFLPVRGKGSHIWDDNGKLYIDFAGGIAVNSLGHAHPAILAALKEQSGKLWHIGNHFTHYPMLTLAKQIIDATFAEQVFFCNSGSEANEAALKLVRKYGMDTIPFHKNQIVSFKNAFHGRTLFTVSAGGQSKYSQYFAPLPGGITHLPFNNMELAEETINEKTCGVIIEPIQGEGGVRPADTIFLQRLRKLCDRYSAILIFDEVQTGMGRTGSLYSYMQYGVVPDVLTTAKALGGGFPIGAMLTTEKFSHTLLLGTHGTTYGGNPLATEVSSVVLSIINTPEVLNGVKKRHKWFMEGFHSINKKLKIFQEIRSMGLLIGCELNKEYAGQAKYITDLSYEEGVILIIAGPDIIRFTPSLIIPEQDLNEGLVRFTRALKVAIFTLRISSGKF